MAYLDKHSTLDPVMVSVVSSNLTGGNFLKFLKPFDVNFGLKCKCDLIVRNSDEKHKIVSFDIKRVYAPVIDLHARNITLDCAHALVVISAD